MSCSYKCIIFSLLKAIPIVLAVHFSNHYVSSNAGYILILHSVNSPCISLIILLSFRHSHCRIFPISYARVDAFGYLLFYTGFIMLV